MTYLEFIFNRFVYGLPVTLLFLSLYGTNANIIGNISIAISMVLRAWDVANIPLMNLRAPLLARLHAEGNSIKFFQSQNIMVCIIILTSSILAILTMTLGPKLFLLFYGKEYENGIMWGIIATVLALVTNFFTLGNNALHQSNKFLPELIGLFFSATFILINGLIFPKYISPNNIPLLILLGFIIGRFLFWLFTDIWADYKLFKWSGSIVKIKGLISS